MNVIRGYSDLFFGDGTKAEATITFDQEQHTLYVESAVHLPASWVQGNTRLLAFTDDGHYEIVYSCPYKYLDIADRAVYTLKLVSASFIRNKDNARS